MSTMNKTQKDALIKAFRLLRQAGAEGETMVHEHGDAKEVVTHIGEIIKHLTVMQDAIGDHLGAQAILANVASARPKAAGKIGRPKLRVVR